MYNIHFGAIIEEDYPITTVTFRKDDSYYKEYDINNRNLVIHYPDGATAEILGYRKYSQFEPLAEITLKLIWKPLLVNHSRVYRQSPSVRTLSMQLMDDKYGPSNVQVQEGNVIVYLNETDLHLINDNYSRLNEILESANYPVFIDRGFMPVNLRYLDLDSPRPYHSKNNLIYRGREEWLIDSVFAAARVLDAIQEKVAEKGYILSNRGADTLRSGVIDYEIRFDARKDYHTTRGPNFNKMGYDNFLIKFRFGHEDIGVLMTLMDSLKHSGWLAELTLVKTTVSMYDEEREISIGLFWLIDDMISPNDAKMERLNIGMPCLSFDVQVTTPIIEGGNKMDTILEGLAEYTGTIER